MKFPKIKNNIGKYLFKTFCLAFVISMMYATGLAMTGLFLGDLGKAEQVARHYSIFYKAILALLSGFFIFWFGAIIKYIFNTFILEKDNF